MSLALLPNAGSSASVAVTRATVVPVGGEGEELTGGGAGFGVSSARRISSPEREAACDYKEDIRKLRR